MSKSERLDEAHTRVKDLAKEMAADGIPDSEIIDALMGVGANAYGRIVGPAELASIFRRVADEIETKGVFTGDLN